MGWESNAIFQVVIIAGGTGSGLFAYSPVPGAGNLVGSVTAAAGVDQFGNNYLAGLTSYLPNGANSRATQVVSGFTQYYTAPASIGPWTLVASSGVSVGDAVDLQVSAFGGAILANNLLKALAGLVVSGGTTDQVVLSNGLAGGDVLKVTNTTAAPGGASTHLIAAAAGDRTFAIQVTGDTVTRLLIDSNGKMLWGPGGAAAQDTDLFRGGVGILQTDSALAITNQAVPGALAGAAQLYATGGQPAYRNPAGLLANLSGSQLAVVTQNTVTQTTFTNLASASIPAADAEVGAVYKVTAYGSGVWGSTQQQLTFGARFGAAQTTVAAQVAIAATALAASAAFEWWTETIVSNVTTGVTGTWQVLIRGTVTQTANALLPGTAADNTIPFAAGTTAAAPYTLDSTIAELMGVSALWASTTGAPTLTKTASFFERIA